MADHNQQNVPEAKPGLFNPTEWPQFIGNWFWRLPGIRRLRRGRVRIGERMPPIWYELRETWFPKNNAWFNTKLRTIEDFWAAQGTHLGDGKDSHGESTLLGKHDGIVKIYEELGAYDIDRLDIEVDFFEVGTGYSDENIKYGIPTNAAEWDRFGWKKGDVEKNLRDPDILKKLPLLKKISLLSGIVYHEGKKELKEELYCFGFSNAKALGGRLNKYNTRIVDELIASGGPVAVRTPANQTAAALTELINKIAEIETETHKELEKLIGIIKPYYTLWGDEVTKYSPESKNIGVIRYHHTYRIIRQYYVSHEHIEEIIAGKEEPLKRKIIIKLRQEKDIYEEEKDDIKEKIDELNELLRKKSISNEEYNLRMEDYQQRLMDIEGNITNKHEIIHETTPNIADNEFWQRPEEVDYGLDENGHPLEINPHTGEVLIDRWWNEIAQNDWQLETIAKKPGGLDYLKRHLEGFDAIITGPRGSPQIGIRNRGARNHGKPRPIRIIKDQRFHGYVDLLELGTIIYSDWDSFRDDLRDGRYHPHSKSVGDYVIEGEGGFDDELGAPHKRGVYMARRTGIGVRRRGGVPLGPTGVAANVKDKNVVIRATPYHFMDRDEREEESSGSIHPWPLARQRIPSEEKMVKRNFKMKLPDGSFLSGVRKPTKYNPAFDRRAENLDYVYWGRMYYYRWAGMVNEWDENPFPHISTRGLALYLDYLVKTDVWNYKDAEDALEGHKMDYGVRGMGKYDEVNPASGKGIIQEN